MQANSYIQLDYARPSINVIHAKQGDALTRVVNIKLLANGQPFSIAENGKTFVVQHLKQDKTRGYYTNLPDGTAAVRHYVDEDGGSYLKVTLAPQTLTCAGKTYCSVSVAEDDLSQILQTFSFVIDVEASEGHGAESVDYFSFPTLENIGEKLEELEKTSLSESAFAWINSLVESGSLHLAGWSSALDDFADSDSAGLPVYDSMAESGVPWTPMMIQRASTDVNGALNIPTVERVKEIVGASVHALTEDGVAYVAEGEELPVVVPGSNNSHVGKGKQIVIIPDHSSTSEDVTLQLNNGAVIPIRRRSETALSETIPAGMLMQGVPYTMTFCGKYWLIDSYIYSKATTDVTDMTAAYQASGETPFDYLLTLTAPGKYYINDDPYQFYCTVHNVDGTVHHEIKDYGDDNVATEYYYISGALVQQVSRDTLGADIRSYGANGEASIFLQSGAQSLTAEQKTQARLNIGAAAIGDQTGVSPLVITVSTEDGETWSADKTFDEIDTAYISGRDLVCMLVDGGTTTPIPPLSYISGALYAFRYESAHDNIAISISIRKDKVSIDFGPLTMGGATADSNGSPGLVPAPMAGDQGKVLNGAGEWVPFPGATNEWELINDITITEQVSSFSISTDMNGNPFSLRKYLLAVAWAQVTDGSTIPSFMFSSENNVTTGPNPPLIYTSGLPAASDSGVMGGYLLTELLPDHTIKQESWRVQYPTTGGANLDPFAALSTSAAKIQQCLGRKDSFEPFFEIGGTNGLLAVGSKIKLWGVRA